MRLFLVDGTVGGLRTAEIMNWTGHVVAAQRSDLGELLQREEAKRTGVYILLGDDQAYVGEADVIRERLKQHNRPEPDGKDFWTDVVIVTSKDANLTKAHARYLESRFIKIAKDVGRMPLTNATSPDPIPLPDADLSDMEYFISQAQIVLPVLGVNLLRGQPAVTSGKEPPAASQDSPVFEMRLPKGGGKARAQEIDGEFTVLAGSQARPKWASREHKRPVHARQELRQALIDKGVLAPQEDRLVFTQNQVFSSPSTAAAVIVGTETHNGRQAWKVEGTTESYGDWQAQQIDAVADAAPAAEG
ncbi:MAG: GIY-YIG nuclease family protein [Propionibacteriaceae bacterium]|nr:GIY-YIG nuclease family protein [Propionibacteriaceae bacterium]